MNIEYLRNFIKLTHYKSFSKLAKELVISQSTLSHQISNIEKEFSGVVLIERTTKSFELTKPGKLLLNYAKQIVNLFDECKSEVSQFKEDFIEDIIISASTLPGSHILPKYLTDFRNKNPNVNFKIVISNSKKSLENLNNKLADFAGVGSFIGYNENEFDSIIIGEDKLKFICSPNHQLIKGRVDTVDFKDLIKFPFVWREKGSGMRNTFKKQFPKYKKLKIELEINSNDSIISTVTESNYISIMSEIIADKAEAAGLIKSLKINDYPLIAERSIYFVKLKDKKLSTLKKKFWTELTPTG